MICHWTKQQKKSALVKIISDICTNVVHYRASGILLITMQLYLFNFFARFECVFHANKNILWFISLKSFVFLSFKRWNCNSFTNSDIKIISAFFNKLRNWKHLTKISYKSCQNKKKLYVIERNNNNKKSALVKIISDICTNVVHYRASGILLITMQLYLFNFFARFECVFHANKKKDCGLLA